MNVIYSADDNYSRHAGISITSLYEKNKDMDEVNVFLINNGIYQENIIKLDSIAKKYGRTITYIDFSSYKKRLVLNNDMELPISTYARLFVDQMLPEDVDKILYLDCDIIINESLEELWNTNMHGCTVAGVEDVSSCLFQSETDINVAYRYICAGVLLIDLVQWRKKDIQNKLIEYIDKKNGVVRHHDQTALNGVLWNDCYILHPKYNALTPTFIMPYKNLRAYFNLWDKYYTKQEILESIKSPAIIHYTSANIGRPWENNAHPLAKIYQGYWKRSPWSDSPWGHFKCRVDKKQIRAYKLYQKAPYPLLKLVLFANKLLKKK